MLNDNSVEYVNDKTRKTNFTAVVETICTFGDAVKLGKAELSIVVVKRRMRQLRQLTYIGIIPQCLLVLLYADKRNNALQSLGPIARTSKSC